jgi:hypothetical protein
MILTSAAVLAFATASFAQQQPAQTSPAPSAPATEGSPGTPPPIRSVSVVDIGELPADTQKRVNDFVAKRSPDELQQLRSSIDATPQVKSALQAKGLTSAEVIAASMGNDGALTLITRKKAG